MIIGELYKIKTKFMTKYFLLKKEKGFYYYLSSLERLSLVNRPLLYLGDNQKYHIFLYQNKFCYSSNKKYFMEYQL